MSVIKFQYRQIIDERFLIETNNKSTAFIGLRSVMFSELNIKKLRLLKEL
ncbi:hypothetical protein [Polynucleobacter sp. 15G-AUS-farblos]|nr:hypothetical protein [Polynucleobacter sp. 15G-AUS-farblos]